MIDRRSFIIATGMTALATTRVFGANEKIQLGLIGAGQRVKGLIDCANKAAPARSLPSATSMALIATCSKSALADSRPRISIIARSWTTRMLMR